MAMQLGDYLDRYFVNRDDADVSAHVTRITRSSSGSDIIHYDVFRLGAFKYTDICSRAAFDHAFPRQA